MDMELITRFTSLGRTIDPRIKNHQIILGLSIVAGAIGSSYGWFVENSSLVGGFLMGVNAGVSAFLAWVLARELDPDHPASGLIGPVLVVPVVLLVGPPSILAGFYVVLLLRIFSRSTGLPAQPLDTMGVILMASLLSVSEHPAVALIGGAALIIDSVLPKGHSYHRGVGAVIAVAGAGYWLYQGSGFVLLGQQNLLIGLVGISLLYLVAISLQAKPESVGDYDGSQLHITRVRTAQISALAIAIIFISLNGHEGLQGQLPLWSAMVGVAVYQLAVTVIQD